MELRVLSPDDWELWREVRLQALADAPEAFGSALADWKTADEDRWRQRLAAAPFNAVAVVDDIAVGQVSGTPIDDAHRVEVISMWCAPSARGAGVADALVAAVKNYALQAGASVVRLSVRRYNARAIALYERMGFMHVEEPGDEPAEIALHCRLRP